MKKIVLMIAMLSVCCACSKPMVSGTVTENNKVFTKDYAATPNQTYYAVRWALEANGYALDSEDLGQGVITSTWRSVTSDSHYIEVFDRPDYGVTDSYYQLRVYVINEEGRTKVNIKAPAKTLATNFMSSGVEEKKILASIGDYLRKHEPDVTNLGVME